MEELNNQNKEFFLIVMTFISKNLLGIMSVIFGVTAKVYLINRVAKRVTRNQCLTTVLFSGLAGSIAWYVVSGLNIQDSTKAVICGFLPIIIEPLILRLIIWINPLIDELGNLVKRLIAKKGE